MVIESIGRRCCEDCGGECVEVSLGVLVVEVVSTGVK
jgi:hypothetical protein